MKKWEYCGVDYHSYDIRYFRETGNVDVQKPKGTRGMGWSLAKLGQDGWELVTIYQGEYILFKREIL